MRTRITQRCKSLLRAARASEFAVCVLLLLALSAAVAPQFSRPSGPSRERVESQHAGRPPGVAAGSESMTSH